MATLSLILAILRPLRHPKQTILYFLKLCSQSVCIKLLQNCAFQLPDGTSSMTSSLIANNFFRFLSDCIFPAFFARAAYPSLSKKAIKTNDFLTILHSNPVCLKTHTFNVSHHVFNGFMLSPNHIVLALMIPASSSRRCICLPQPCTLQHCTRRFHPPKSPGPWPRA